MLDLLEKLPEERVREHYERIGLNEASLEESLNSLREWISMQPNLPKNISKRFLKNFLLRLNNSMERTKQKITDYYKIMYENPDILKPCDPAGDEFKNQEVSIYSEYMPKLSPEGYRVGVVSIRSPDYSDYSFMVKLNAMKTRIYLEEADFDFGNILLVDCNMLTAKVALSHTPSLLKIHAQYIQNTPFRLKALVIVNANSFIEFGLNTFKMFMSDKLKKRVFIYAGGVENFLKHVPQNVLPTDYNGPEYSLEELKEKENEKLMEYRDYFLDEMKLIEEQSKNIAKDPTSSQNSMFGTEGSFRKLALD